MREGSLDAPMRHPIAWQDPDFLRRAEARRGTAARVRHPATAAAAASICADSFPRLFDLIDDSESGELDTVDSKDFEPVVEACTLCDMCFMTKCPYVPPHEFNLDSPHLMLRYRIVEKQKGKAADGMVVQLTETDRNGNLARFAAADRQLGVERDEQGDAAAPGIAHRRPPGGAPAQVQWPDLHGPLGAGAGGRQRGRPPAYGRKAVL